MPPHRSVIVVWRNFSLTHIYKQGGGGGKINGGNITKIRLYDPSETFPI